MFGSIKSDSGTFTLNHLWSLVSYVIYMFVTVQCVCVKVAWLKTTHCCLAWWQLWWQTSALVLMHACMCTYCTCIWTCAAILFLKGTYFCYFEFNQIQDIVLKVPLLYYNFILQCSYVLKCSDNSMLVGGLCNLIGFFDRWADLCMVSVYMCLSFVIPLSFFKSGFQLVFEIDNLVYDQSTFTRSYPTLEMLMFIPAFSWVLVSGIIWHFWCMALMLSRSKGGNSDCYDYIITIFFP